MRNMELIDSHLHLQDYDRGTDIARIIAESLDAGVSTLVCNGTEEADWHEVLEFAESYPQVVPCLGLHPWFVRDRSPEWADSLEELVASTNCGVGEIGLDKCVEGFDSAEQEEAFRVQLGIARKYNRPAMVHCVRTWGLMMDVLRSEEPLPSGMLFHAYGGPADLVRELAAMGAYFSFSATVLNPNHKRAREALTAVPRDRLLIETDAPNMLPSEEFRAWSVPSSDGTSYNHPANLPLVLNGIAALLGEDQATLAAQMLANAERLNIRRD